MDRRSASRDSNPKAGSSARRPADFASTHSRSKALYDQALIVEPNGVGGSDIRAPRQGWEPFPLFMARGDGAYLEDVDGNRYIDYVAAWGPMILGYRPRRVLDAVHKTLDDMGSLLGFNHELEVVAAEAAIAAVPSWEQMRFSNTGTEAVMLALRIARAYTNRTKVLCFEGHFHGWADTIYFTADQERIRAGEEGDLPPIPTTHGMLETFTDSLVMRRWNDPDVLRRTFSEIGDQLAAVICEPLLCGPVIEPKPGYLELLRELTTKHGVVLIYDEVKTGFRIGLGGAQEKYGVLPDLSTAAKALGAGFPIAAVGGRKELFEPFTRGYIRQGSTYQASPLVLSAAIATLEELRQPGFYERLNSMGERLTEGLTALANEAGLAAEARGVGSVVQLTFSEKPIDDYREYVRTSDGAMYTKFWRGMFDGGVISSPRGCWFVSSAHTDKEVEATLDVAGDVLMRIASERHAPSAS